MVTHFARTELKRALSLLDSMMINIGSMIGSGIFLVPATLALYLHSSGLVMVVWIVGGIVSLFGALSVAELGALYPRAGGLYVYLSEAYGPLWGFLYGWTAFAVIMTGAISAVGVGFATYLGHFIPLSEVGIKIVAIASIVLLTAVNCFGVKAGALVQNGFTFLKIATLGAFVLLGLVWNGGTIHHPTAPLESAPMSDLAGPFGLALVAVLWSYDGWIEITYVAGEVKNPRRNIPLSLILSTMFVVVIYTLVNYTYLSVLSLDAISTSTLVAADAATVIIGPGGAAMAAIAVIIATMGSNNGFVLTGARIYYAMATDRMFFRFFSFVHPKYQTPIPSLIGQGIWASALVMTGTFDQLFTYVIFSSWIFYAMAAGAVMVLRAKAPLRARSYKTWGYPVTPIVFMLFSLYLVINTLIEDPRDALVGLGIISLGVPAYLYWKGLSNETRRQVPY